MPLCVRAFSMSGVFINSFRAYVTIAGYPTLLIKHNQNGSYTAYAHMLVPYLHV
jgi:hypothetical protein